jgi:hypothetical protein
MTLDQYFALPDTPMANSPIGIAMRSICGHMAVMDYSHGIFEIVRSQAQERIYGFSKRSRIEIRGR